MAGKGPQAIVRVGPVEPLRAAAQRLAPPDQRRAPAREVSRGDECAADDDTLHSEEFVFDCPYVFSERYSGAEGYFNVGQKRYESGMQHIWETNFIMDIQSANLDQREVKGAGVRITQFELSGNSLIGHLAQWPAARYHKAHYHGAGAILLGLQSSGYVLLWSKELGIRPYEAGHDEDVVEVKWKAGSVYCPPGGGFTSTSIPARNRRAISRSATAAGSTRSDSKSPISTAKTEFIST
jgi:hypothetical protein